METIIKKNICDQYLEDAGRYSLYVNRMRSLPDAKDGLKPIHRRILYSGLNDTKCIEPLLSHKDSVIVFMGCKEVYDIKEKLEKVLRGN